MKIKKYYHFFLHILFIIGIFYALGQFITTPRVQILERRMWAYENWIILSFYALFVFLTLKEREFKIINGKTRKREITRHIKQFKEILAVNLILLVFPWGLFILLAPQDLMSLIGLTSVYWRVLGFMSLVGAAIYFLPYKFFKRKITYYVLIFGAFDNLAAALVLTWLFIERKINLLAFSSAPLLYYFANFFLDQAQNYKHLVKKK